MPTVPRSYTLAVLEEPRSKPNLHRKSPVSRSKLVSTVLGLIIHQNKNKSTPGLVGLRNLGNTCFMNSILQCLSNTAELRDYCLTNVHRSDLNSANATLTEEFAKLTQSLWRSGNAAAVCPSGFRNQIQRFAPKFVGCSQQDAQEFLRSLLDGLHSEVNRATVPPTMSGQDFDYLCDDEKARRMWNLYLQSEDSKVVDLFVGQLKSSVTCSVCGFTSTAFDPFWDLSVPLAQKSSGQVTLKDCLRLFTEEDVLDGEESPMCCRCKSRRKCTKRLSIQRFPQILVLHLKRFSDCGAASSKVSTFVNFPLRDLELREFCSDGGERVTYDLYAVSNHSGDALDGHYTAFCRHPSLGEWYSYNDSRVSPVSSSSVRSSNAYVLFYQLQSSPHGEYQTCRL